MKKQLCYLLSCFLLLLYAACGQENKKSDAKDSTNPGDSFVVNEEYSDDHEEEEESFADTTYSLQIKGKIYLLAFSHEAVPFHEAGQSTTVRIVEHSTHDTLYEKTFDFNSVGALRNPAPDHYWIGLLNSGGGSGYSATLFNIKLEPEIILQPIFNFNELSSWMTNRTANEIVLFEGFWDMSSNEEPDFEAHFSGHRQQILVYQIGEEKVTMKELGSTKEKYDLYSNDTTMREIKRNESALLKSIDWASYDLNAKPN